MLPAPTALDWVFYSPLLINIYTYHYISAIMEANPYIYNDVDLIVYLIKHYPPSWTTPGVMSIYESLEVPLPYELESLLWPVSKSSLIIFYNTYFNPHVNIPHL